MVAERLFVWVGFGLEAWDRPDVWARLTRVRDGSEGRSGPGLGLRRAQPLLCAVGWHGDACMQPSMRWASAQPGLPVDRKYNQAMPALAKVTLAQRQEIRRRRAAGETLLSIGRLLGLPHQTVSRIDWQERALQAEREAEAAAEHEAEGALRGSSGRAGRSASTRTRAGRCTRARTAGSTTGRDGQKPTRTS
jgi:Helix-turn-helix domain